MVPRQSGSWITTELVMGTCLGDAAVTRKSSRLYALPRHPTESMKPIQDLEGQRGVQGQSLGLQGQQLGWAGGQQQPRVVRATRHWRFAPVSGVPTALAWLRLVALYLLEHTHAVKRLPHCQQDRMTEGHPTVKAVGLQGVGRGAPLGFVGVARGTLSTPAAIATPFLAVGGFEL